MLEEAGVDSCQLRELGQGNWRSLESQHPEKRQDCPAYAWESTDKDISGRDFRRGRES